MLELPQLGRVPRAWTLHRANPMAARTALALLTAGHLPADHPPAADPAELVRAGLKLWIDGHTSGLKLFEFTIHYNEIDPPARSARLTDVFKPRIGIAILCNHGPRGVLIGKHISRLQATYAGLGETILYWIKEAAAATLPVYTPSYALDAASWNYWGGCENEKERLEEMKLNGEDPDDYEMFTRAEFDRAVPAWAQRPKKRLDLETVRRLANPRRTRKSGRVARALLTLIGALAEYRRRIDLGIADDLVPFFPPPLALMWGDGALMSRIFDDLGQDFANSGEYREDFARATVDDGPGFDRGLQAFLAGIEPVFPILRTLETLVALITDKDYG